MNLARLLVAAVFALSGLAGTALAQAPVRVLVGVPPGGDLDAVARLFAEKLAAGLGRPVVVENRAGAAMQIAMTALKASAPDGNTLMVVPDTTLTLYPHTIKTPAYDTLREVVPIAHLGTYEYALAVGANVPARDLGQWLNWVKTDNRNAAVGSPGAGTGSHFLSLILAQAAGVHLVSIPFRGMAPALADLVAGQVPAAIITLGALVRQAKSGKIRILAHTGSQRSSIAPEVPSFKELGYPALEVLGWYGIIAPAGIRPELVARYNKILIQAQRDAAVRERMRALYLEFRDMTPAEVAAMAKAEYDRWGPVVKASGFSANSR